MKFKILILLIFSIFLYSCEQYEIGKTKSLNIGIEKKYKNSGFALVYDESLNLKKLDHRSFEIFQNSLKKNLLLKLPILQITNF